MWPSKEVGRSNTRFNRSPNSAGFNALTFLGGRKQEDADDRSDLRRKILKAGATATVMAAVPRAFAQQTGQGGVAMSFYEKGPVRIRYQEVGSGFPLLLIAVGD